MKKTKVGCILAYTAVFCGVAIVAGNGAAGAIKADGAAEDWGHYLAASPSYFHGGSNEFWISCNTHLVSTSAPSGNVNIIERGTPSGEMCDTFKNISDGRYIDKITEIEYGSYPQTIAPTSLNGTLDLLTPGADGFVTYNDEKYEKMNAPYSNTWGYQYTDGTSPSESEYRYFKVEPIKWKILEASENTLLLLSEKVLDCRRFSPYANAEMKEKEDYQHNTDTVYDNNYKYSEIRSFINTDFIQRHLMELAIFLTLLFAMELKEAMISILITFISAKIQLIRFSYQVYTILQILIMGLHQQLETMHLELLN